MDYDCKEAATSTAIDWIRNVREDGRTLIRVTEALPLLGTDDHQQAVSAVIDRLFPYDPLTPTEDLAMSSITLLLDMADWDKVRSELESKS